MPALLSPHSHRSPNTSSWMRVQSPQRTLKVTDTKSQSCFIYSINVSCFSIQQREGPSLSSLEAKATTRQKNLSVFVFLCFVLLIPPLACPDAPASVRQREGSGAPELSWKAVSATAKGCPPDHRSLCSHTFAYLPLRSNLIWTN